MEQLLTQLTKYYEERFPQLNSNISPEDDITQDLIPAFLQMIRDIDVVVEAKTGDYMPSYEGDDDPVWADIDNAINVTFTRNKKLYLRYLHWSHASQPQELSSPQSNRKQAGQRGKPHKRKNNDSNRKNGGGQGKGNKSNNKRRNNPENRKRDPNIERKIIKEVLLAVQKLNSDDSVKEVKLAPTNSYHRRLQHTQIKEEGLDSRSVGAGNKRSVVIFKSQPEKSNEES